MNSDEPKFPTFIRTPKRKEEASYFCKEIDTGRGAKVLDDKRPIVLEYWYDSDTALNLVTAFYSRKGIAEWNDNEHKEYLVRNGVMKASDHVPSTFIFEDDAGNPMWSVNWVEGY